MYYWLTIVWEQDPDELRPIQMTRLGTLKFGEPGESPAYLTLGEVQRAVDYCYQTSVNKCDYYHILRPARD